MRSRFIVCLGLIACLSLTGIAALAQNPVANPSFESGLTGWTAYGYGAYSSNPAVRTVGPPGFDVLHPDDGASDGSYVCGYQGWWSAGTGGVYQTFTAPSNGFLAIAARAFSLDGGFNQVDKGNRIRAALVDGVSTNRADVAVWTDCAWGAAWNDIVLPVPVAGQYTLFIEHTIPTHECIFSSLWDNVRWQAIPPVFIADGPNVIDVSETSATIVWDTDIESNSIVSYDTTGPPFDNTITDATPVTHHVVTLTGLTPGMRYHLQVRSEAPPSDPAVSGEVTFTTTTAVQPTLANGDFEATASGVPTLEPWTKFGPLDGLFGPNTQNPNSFGIPARSGSHFVGTVASSGTKDMGGIFQRVSVVPGKTYAASVWIWTENNDGDLVVPGPASNTTCRVGIDPTGGMDFNGPNVIWSPWDHSQDWQPPYAQLGLKQISVMAEVPVGNVIATVFVQEHQQWPVLWNRNGFDDVTFAEAIPANTLGQAKSNPLGWGVDITNGGAGLLVTKIEGLDELVTGVPAPFCWVQEDDRSSGIKVRLDGMGWTQQQIDAIERGCRINLKGTTNRRGLNDYYYGDTEILATEITIVSTGNADPKPLGFNSKSAGGTTFAIQRGPTGGTGANNVGLLVKLAGNVVGMQDPVFGSPYPYYFFVDDGSGVKNPVTNEPGIKVWHPWDEYYWASAPTPSMVPGAAMVAVTGVLCLEVYDPTPDLNNNPNGSGDEVLVPTIRLRDGRDIQVE